MKEFARYNILRLLMLLGWVSAVLAVLFLIDDAVTPNEMLIALLIAFVGSGITSWFFLAPQREALAARIQDRASSAASKFEDARKAPGEK